MSPYLDRQQVRFASHRKALFVTTFSTALCVLWKDHKPDEFKVFDNRDCHPEWVKKAEPVVKSVHAMWQNVGM